MISWALALELSNAGLRWAPESGDRFRIRHLGEHGDVYVVSDMTIEPHAFDTGTILGFNGTTEWALDSIAIEDTLWHPTENQLRELLGATFHSLNRTGDRAEPQFTVVVETVDGPVSFSAPEASDAYAQAVLRILAP